MCRNLETAILYLQSLRATNETMAKYMLLKHCATHTLTIEIGCALPTSN